MSICEMTERMYHAAGKAVKKTKMIAGAGIISIALAAGCSGSGGGSGGSGGGNQPPANEAPTLAALPHQNFDENSGFHDNVLDLWQYASDKESADDMLDYSITGQTNASAVDCAIDSNRYVDCTVKPGVLGSSDINVRVADTEGKTAESTFTINVNNDPSTCSLPVGCSVVERPDYSAISGEYNTLADVLMGNTALPPISRFSMDASVMLPEQYDWTISDGINKMVMTLKTDKGYEMAWFKDILSVDRECSKTRITLQDGESMHGTFVDNGDIRNFYNLTQGELRGIMNIGGVDKVIGLSPQCFSSISLDLAQSQPAFEAQHSAIFSGLSAPVSIELNDGTTVSSDLGYIIDPCGHYYSNHFHTRLSSTLELIGSDGIITAIPLGEVSEIELTGEFDVANPQARKVIVSYKDGTQESSSLYLTSESYGGVCTTSSRFREYDSMIMHNTHGAQVFRLDNVKKIRPNQPYIPPKNYIMNKDELEGIVLTSWQKLEYLSSAVYSTLMKLRDMGVESVAILTTYYQDTKTSTDIYPLDNFMNGTPTDEAIRHIIREVKNAGLKPVLKPHIDCMDGSYRGNIDFGADEAAWTAWFSEYNNFIMHYAEIAQQEDVDLFIIGTELDRTTQRPEWDNIIQNIKSVYTGKITYGANWDSYPNVGFVDQLDVAGIDVYRPLTDVINPPQELLDAAWQTIRAELAAYSQSIGKKLLVTEVGYQDREGTNMHPWWTGTPSSDAGRQEQANCFKAMLKAVHNGYDPENADIFYGIFIWNENFDLKDYNGFAVVGKPAGDAISEAYHLLDSDTVSATMK